MKRQIKKTLSNMGINNPDRFYDILLSHYNSDKNLKAYKMIFSDKEILILEGLFLTQDREIKLQLLGL